MDIVTLLKMWFWFWWSLWNDPNVQDGKECGEQLHSIKVDLWNKAFFSGVCFGWKIYGKYLTSNMVFKWTGKYS